MTLLMTPLMTSFPTLLASGEFIDESAATSAATSADDKKMKNHKGRNSVMTNGDFMKLIPIVVPL